MVDTFWRVVSWENVENMGKRPFFRAATAGLVKYGTVGYGRIGVYIMSISPVNICWLRHSTGARLDKDLSILLSHIYSLISHVCIVYVAKCCFT